MLTFFRISSECFLASPLSGCGAKNVASNSSCYIPKFFRFHCGFAIFYFKMFFFSGSDKNISLALIALKLCHTKKFFHVEASMHSLVN